MASVDSSSEIEPGLNFLTSKPSKTQNEDASKVMRIIQSLFSTKEQIPTNNRQQMADEILKFLSNNPSHSCSKVVSSFLKCFVNWYMNWISLHANSLKKYAIEVDLLGRIVDMFPGSLLSFKKNLLMIVIKDVSYQFMCEEYSASSYDMVELFVKIFLAGKWSTVNSGAFRKHYFTNVSHLCESIYFLCYKHEFFKNSTFTENIIDRKDASENIFCSKGELLQLSEHVFIDFVSFLMAILNRLISVKIELQLDFPMYHFFCFCQKLLSYSPTTQNGSSDFWSIQIDAMSIMDKVIRRCGTLCLPAGDLVTTAIDNYLRAASCVLPSAAKQADLNDNYFLRLSGAVTIAKTMMR